MKMNLSETSTDMVDLVNENETRATNDFYNKLSNMLSSLEYCTRQLEPKRILTSVYATTSNTHLSIFEDFPTEFQIADSKSNEGRIYRLTYNRSINQFYLNDILIRKDLWISIRKNHQDFGFTTAELNDFQSWVDNTVPYLIHNYGYLDLSDVPSDLTSFMNLHESYNYLKELEAVVNEHKSFINLNEVGNKPLIEEGAYKLNLIKDKLSKEIVLRLYYDNQLDVEVQEYDCPLNASREDLKDLLANTTIDWGSMCFDALEALYKLINIEKVKERTTTLEIISKDEIKSTNGLSIPTGVLEKVDSTITINLTTSVTNLFTILQSLSTSDITLNINLTE